MITLRKQYSAKYQVLELTTEVEDYEKLQVESANFDAIAKSELSKMVSLVEVFDDKKETNVVPAPAKAPEKATANQWACIKKNEARAKMVAEELGITLDDNLSKANAYKLITKLVNKQ